MSLSLIFKLAKTLHPISSIQIQQLPKPPHRGADVDHYDVSADRETLGPTKKPNFSPHVFHNGASCREQAQHDKPDGIWPREPSRDDRSRPPSIEPLTLCPCPDGLGKLGAAYPIANHLNMG